MAEPAIKREPTMKIEAASATVAINDIASKKRMDGEQIFNFAAGDPLIPNHEYILQKAQEQISKKLSPYPPVEGLAALRQQAANWINESNQATYEQQNVLVTPGGKWGLFATVQ